MAGLRSSWSRSLDRSPGSGGIERNGTPKCKVELCSGRPRPAAGPASARCSRPYSFPPPSGRPGGARARESGVGGADLAGGRTPHNRTRPRRAPAFAPRRHADPVWPRCPPKVSKAETLHAFSSTFSWAFGYFLLGLSLRISIWIILDLGSPTFGRAGGARGAKRGRGGGYFRKLDALSPLRAAPRPEAPPRGAAVAG